MGRTLAHDNGIPYWVSGGVVLIAALFVLQVCCVVACSLGSERPTRESFERKKRAKAAYSKLA